MIIWFGIDLRRFLVQRPAWSKVSPDAPEGSSHKVLKTPQGPVTAVTLGTRLHWLDCPNVEKSFLYSQFKGYFYFNLMPSVCPPTMPCSSLLHCLLGLFADPVSCFVGLPKASSSPGARNPVPSVSPSKMVLQPPKHSVALYWTSSYFCSSCTDSTKPEWWIEQYNCFTLPKACIPPVNATKRDVDFAARACIWIIFSLLFTKILRFSLAELLPSQSFLEPVLLQDILPFIVRTFLLALLNSVELKGHSKLWAKTKQKYPI